jgi:hypothetical protein
LVVTDSVLDAGGAGTVVEGTDRRDAFVQLTLRRVTALGAVDVERIATVEDSIVTGPLTSEQRQTGQVLFSWVPPGSRTPRRFGCQPDGVLEQVDPRLPAERRQAAQAAEIRRVAPAFDSVRLPRPGYARLSDRVADELRRGAADEGELGVHHDLWAARRVADLLIRLAEFTPAGFDCGPVFAT